VHYLKQTFAKAQSNLALDESLLNQFETGEEHGLIRFWEPTQPCVVAGYGNRISSEVQLEECRFLNIPVLRRITGGGAVVQGPGCLVYSLILPFDPADPLANVVAANRSIMDRQRRALQTLLTDRISVEGTTDLVLGDRKFSGNAQKRGRRALLFHGVFLLEFDLSLIDRLLPLPTRRPDYRRDRGHGDFVTNIHLQPSEVINAVRNEWQADQSSPIEIDWPTVDLLAQEKYASNKWIHKR